MAKGINEYKNQNEKINSTDYFQEEFLNSYFVEKIVVSVFECISI